MPKLPPRIYKIGKETVERAHYGEALKARRELAEAGKVGHSTPIVEVEATPKNGKVTVVPGIAAMGAAPNVSMPNEILKTAANAWQSNVVDPIANTLKSQMSPVIQVGEQQYPTANLVTDTGISLASDPLNYIDGPVGAAVGAAQMAASYADGGVVSKADEQPQDEGVQAYDISGAQPQLGHLPHDQVEGALASGRFSLPQGSTLDVVSPDGELGTIPAEQATGAFKAGYKYATPALAKETKYGTDLEVAKTAAEGALDSATFGLSGAATNIGYKIAPDIFASPEDRLARAETNPNARMVGQVAGLFAPTGAGSLMAKAGEAVAAKLAAKTVIGKLGSAAAKSAVENVIFQTGDEAAKMFMSDPHQTAETAITNLGLSAVIGGTLGGTLGGVGMLWNAGPGKKLAQVLGGLKGKAAGLSAEEARLAGLELPPEVIASMEPGFAKEQGVALQQSDTLAGRTYQKNLGNTYTQLENSAAEAVGADATRVKHLDDLSDHASGEKLRKSLEEEVRTTYEPINKEYKTAEKTFSNAELHPDLRASLETEITNYAANKGLAKAVDSEGMDLVQKTLSALGKQENAQDLRLMAQNLADKHGYGKDTYIVARDLGRMIKVAQDSATAAAAESIGGMAFGQEFKALQGRYRAYKTKLDDLASYMGLGRVGGTENFSKVLREKLDSAVLAQRLTKDSVELRTLLTDNFPQTAQTVKDHAKDQLIAKSRVKSGEAIDINKLAKNLEKLDPESRATLFSPEQLAQLSKLHSIAEKLPKNDNYSGTAKALSRQWGAIPAAAGGMAGMMMGDNEHNAVLGAIGGAMLHQATPALRLATLRFLATEAPISAQGFKAMLGMAKNVAKGEAKLNTAVEEVFTGAKNGTAQIDNKAIEKLKQQVNAVSEKPELLLGMGDHIGHYMPDAAEATAMAASRNVMYLASLRPQTAPMSPLDGIRKVSKQEESEYNRALEIAENPLVVLDHVRNGRLDAKDLQHLQNLAPQMQTRMQQKLTDQLVKHLHDGGTVPFKTQLGLSVFLKQPMSSSLQPQAIMAAQPRPMAPTATGGVNSTATGMKSLQKMPGMYQTTSQARQSQRAGRK